MAQIINTNVSSLNAQRNLNATQSVLAQSIQRLSTGLRVNSAKDDAAGLAIAERLNSQIRGMNVAIRNTNDGISLAQTAEGALGKVGEMAQRMRELAVQAANVTNSQSDRDSLNSEFGQLASEITRTLNATTFNGTQILSAGAGTLTFQIGAGTSAGVDTLDVTSTNLASAAAVTTVTGSNITSAANASTAMGNLDSLINEVNTQRATWGAVQNRFDAVIANLQVSVENQAASRSRIMDADFASETASLTRAQVLQQAGVAMLSQANSTPNSVLALLR